MSSMEKDFDTLIKGVKIDREKLQAKYDFLKPTNLQEGLMAFGFDCGNGWLSLLEDLFEDIDREIKKEKIKDFKVIQIKEKFGGLRVYVYGGSGKINDLIDEAEKNSNKICEKCGSKENVTKVDTGWINTLCLNCKVK